MKNSPITVLAFAAVMAFAGNAQAESTDTHGGSHETTLAAAESDHGATTTSTKAAAGHGTQWAYSGKAGPENWGGLSRDYHVCGAGAMQSPVDITGGFAATGDPIEFDYCLTPLTVLHNGHTVQANYEPGSGITVNGERFELLQLHFHTPSEHAVEGQLAAMEVHLVHMNAAGALAVVGAMMEGGSENPALREIWDNMPLRESAGKTLNRVMINARDLLPADTSYYRYMGSLTTPPCSEGVNWFVLTNPIQVGLEQVSKFVAAVGSNNRPLQPRNHRLVLAPGARQ